MENWKKIVLRAAAFGGEAAQCKLGSHRPHRCVNAKAFTGPDPEFGQQVPNRPVYFLDRNGGWSA